PQSWRGPRTCRPPPEKDRGHAAEPRAPGHDEGRPNPQRLGDRADHERAERERAAEGERVEAHHATAERGGCGELQRGVAACHEDNREEAELEEVHDGGVEVGGGRERHEREAGEDAREEDRAERGRAATAGPTMRAPLNAAELRAIAFTRSSFPTISTTKTWRVGMSITFAQPRRSARTATCQYWTCPLQTSAVIVNAWRARADWVARISRRLGSRSTIAPATTENIKTGANWNVPMSPSLSGEPLSCSTSHDWATDCIHVPISETSWPPQKKRKSRWLSARSASGKGIASFPACAVPAAK